MAATLKRRAPLPATDLHSYDAAEPCDVVGRIQESVIAVTTVLNAAADPGASQLWASQSLYSGRIEELLARWLEGVGLDWERWREDGARQVKVAGKVICGRVVESAVDAMQDKIEEMASVFQQLVAMGELPAMKGCARWCSGDSRRSREGMGAAARVMRMSRGFCRAGRPTLGRQCVVRSSILHSSRLRCGQCVATVSPIPAAGVWAAAPLASRPTPSQAQLLHPLSRLPLPFPSLLLSPPLHPRACRAQAGGGAGGAGRAHGPAAAGAGVAALPAGVPRGSGAPAAGR